MTGVTVQSNAAAIERIARAHAAFLDLLNAGLNPTLTSAVMSDTHWREGEFDVVIEGSWSGVLHEEIKAALTIAEHRGGSLFLTKSDGRLAILFPVERDPGPIGADGPSPGVVAQREARRGTRKKAVAS